MHDQDVLSPARGGKIRGALEAVWGSACLGVLAGGLWLSAASGGVPDDEALPALAGIEAGGQPAAPTAPAAGRAIPGWLVEYGKPAQGKAKALTATVPAASFSLDRGESLHPAMPASGLAAHYSTQVTITNAGRYRFGATVLGGSVELKLTDARGRAIGQASGYGAVPPAKDVLTQWVELPAGPVNVSVRFTRIGNNPSLLRTVWEMAGPSGFMPEPIPVGVASIGGYNEEAAAAATDVFHGRVMLGELGCVSCHGGELASAAAAASPAPLLGEIGRRASPEWLLAWITDPHAIKPGTRMPDVIGDTAEDRADAEAIVHFLVGMGGPAAFEPVATEAQVLENGRRLYHTVGCVSCHGAFEAPAVVFGDPSLPAQVPASEPLHPLQPGKAHLTGKWRAGALAEFLKDPLRTHPGGRMPSMLLSDEESDLIATYLINAWGQSQGAGAGGFAVDKAKAEIGRAAFAARGCASCHEVGHSLPDVEPTIKARALSALRPGEGCLDPNDPATPRYTLDKVQRERLNTTLRHIASWPAERFTASPIDRAALVTEALACRECHSWGGRGGPAEDENIYYHTLDEVELGDEGRIPPHLNGVGWKLNPQWTHAVLTEGGRARPYMATRMPQFGEANVGALAPIIAAMDGAPENTAVPDPQVTDELVVAGRKLAGEAGLNCISCHVFGDRPPAGTPGPDITGFAARLRYGWWKNYAHAPGRYKPGTRMPAFFMGGASAASHILDGKADRQIDALWAYFTLGDFMPAPEGVPGAGGLPLQIGDRPVVFRTFLADAGSRGIAVGFPTGLHFAFDAASPRLVDVWRGDFIDATGAWKGRGGQVTGGRGETVWNAPAGPAIVIGERPDAWPKSAGRDAGYAFRGYALDDAGVPTFRYRVGDAEVAERFEPVRGGAAFRRTFTVSGVPAGQRLWVNAGPGAAAPAGLENAKASTRDGGPHAIEPVDPARPVVFTIEYTL